MFYTEEHHAVRILQEYNPAAHAIQIYAVKSALEEYCKAANRMTANSQFLCLKN